jgi:hypothetical protein
MSASIARDGARGSGRRLSAALLLGGVLAVALAGPVGATHTEGTLDCGAAGVYEVEAGSALPPGFEAPGPWSGVFLLHGTTSVFKAFAIATPAWTIERTPATRYPRTLLTCTLSSSGPNFQSDWTLVGFLTP